MNAILLALALVGAHLGGTIGLWGTYETPSYELNSKTNPNAVCKRTQSVLQVNTDFCSSRPEIVSKVLEGIGLSVDECQNRFRNRKWNCTTKRRSIRKILQHDYRETAFVFAITSAGITFAVSRACSLGQLQGCGCRQRELDAASHNLTPKDPDDLLYEKRSVHDNGQVVDEADRNEFERRGCQHDYTQFGYNTAKQFMDQLDSRDAKALIARHNNEAGRLAVKNHMQRKCRCHGLSQTCQMKTCWPELPRFAQVGDRIKTHFDGAVKVYVDNKGERIEPEESTVKPPTTEDLVYTTRSPDFCNIERRTGSLGTSGRTCNETSPGTGGCDLLCCGRGYERTLIEEKVNCMCQLHWCCEVRCKKCLVKRIIHSCK